MSKAGETKSPFPARTAEPKKPRRWLRRLIWGTLIVLGLVYLVGPRLAAPFVRDRLQKMVSERLNAELTMERLSYDFPYGVVARNAALVAKDAQGNPVDLLRVKELRLSLVELPFGDGPLLIEKVIIRDPTANLVMDENGVLAGFKGLVKDEPKPAPAAPDKPKKEKPSDYFRLRRLEISGGQITYLRRGEDADRMAIWKDLAVETNISPTSGAVYSFDIMARQMPLAVTNIRGKVNIDEARLEVEKYVIALKAGKSHGYTMLPPVLAKFLEENRIEGSLSLSGEALVPLREPWKATHESVLELPMGRGRLAALEGDLDRVSLKLRVSSEIPPAERDAMDQFAAANVGVGVGPTTSPTTRPDVRRLPPAYLLLEHFEVASGGTSVRLEKGKGIMDPQTGQWRIKDLMGRAEVGADHQVLPQPLRKLADRYAVAGKMNLSATAWGPLSAPQGHRLLDVVEYELAAYPREVTVLPKNWPMPLTGISGAVRANKQVMTFENVEARYGEDKLFVQVARLPLGPLDHELRIEEIAGTVVMAGKDQEYPKFLRFVGSKLHPMGSWAVAGRVERPRDLPPGEKGDFTFNLIGKDVGLALTSKRVPVTDVQAEVTVSPSQVTIKRAEGKLLGGSAVVKGRVLMPGKGAPAKYDLETWVRDLDLKALSRVLASAGQPTIKLSGKGNMNAVVSGLGSSDENVVLDTLTASGRFEVLEGDFWEVPVLKEIVGGVKVAKEALTAGQAVGKFEIRERIVFLKEAAVSAPVLGVQGSGKVGFDRQVELRAVAAPLADWKDQMKRTKIPLISDVAGELLGGLQAMLNAASKTLLYEFKITGTTKAPKVETIPAPVLTEGVAKMFGAMLKGEKLGESMEKP